MTHRGAADVGTHLRKAASTVVWIKLTEASMFELATLGTHIFSALRSRYSCSTRMAAMCFTYLLLQGSIAMYFARTHILSACFSSFLMYTFTVIMLSEADDRTYPEEASVQTSWCASRSWPHYMRIWALVPSHGVNVRQMPQCSVMIGWRKSHQERQHAGEVLHPRCQCLKVQVHPLYNAAAPVALPVSENRSQLAQHEMSLCLVAALDKLAA